MKKNWSKALSLLLIAGMITGNMAACGGTAENNEKSGAASGNETETREFMMILSRWLNR
mgnify:CR=1 FL=1